MPHFIKTGNWDLKSKAPKEYLNLDLLIEKIASGITPPSTSTDNVGIFYVSKNYTGVASALVADYTIAGITSANTSYTTQLANAKMGSENHAYPDPWSARNAAMTAITAATISKAIIIVLGGATWTYGSNTLIQNGDSTGNPSVNETPDIKFTIGFDLSSLAKNNIYYYFNAGSTLIAINKSVTRHLVYNVDLLDTAWSSGFFGEGNFLTPYGTAQGLSQRFIEIENARAEFTFHAENVVGNRVFAFIYNRKNIKFDIKKWYGDTSTSIIYEQGDSREGDGSPSVIDVRIKEAIYGNAYSPYPLATTSTSSGNQRSFITKAGPSTNIRQKHVNIQIDSLSMETGFWYGTLVGGQYASTAATNNYSFNLHIKALKEVIGAYVTGSIINCLITTNYNNYSTISRFNNNYNITIDRADIESPLLDTRNIFTATPGNLYNSLKFKGGFIVRKPLSVSTATQTLMGDSIFSIPLATGAIDTTAKPFVQIEVDEAIAVTGYCFSNQGMSGTFFGNTVVKGNYKTLAANPVIYLRNAGNSCILDNVSLISAGTNSIDGSATGRLIYAKTAHSNVAENVTNVTNQGSAIVVDTDILNYL